MIAHISGIVADKYDSSLVVDVNGVGYQIQVTLSDFEKAVQKEKITLYTYHHIRETTQDLFGFSEKSAKSLFQQLLNVKNVGPKVALAVLDIGSTEYVRIAIANGEVKTLQTAKGVGKRAAEQMIVELRDKVGYEAGSEAEAVVARAGINQDDEALQALIALGYSDIDAQKALQNIDQSLSTEERVKQALKG